MLAAASLLPQGVTSCTTPDNKQSQPTAYCSTQWKQGTLLDSIKITFVVHSEQSPYAGCQAIIKFRLMADHKNSSFVLFQCVFQLLFRVHVKMVRRLVEDKEVGFALMSLQRRTFACSSAERTRTRLSMCCVVRTAFGERCADFILGIGWKFFPISWIQLLVLPFGISCSKYPISDNRQAPRFRQGTESNRGYSLRVLFFRFRWHR